MATHHELCRLAARYIHEHTAGAFPNCPQVAVEVRTPSAETPDIFGWNYWTTALVEAKVSRADFKADLKKKWRIYPKLGVGEYRYYCCPKDLIGVEELPENWGLIYENDGVLELIKKAQPQESNWRATALILASIMRQEGFKPKIYDYKDYYGKTI